MPTRVTRRTAAREVDPEIADARRRKRLEQEQARRARDAADRTQQERAAEIRAAAERARALGARLAQRNIEHALANPATWKDARERHAREFHRWCLAFLRIGLTAPEAERRARSVTGGDPTGKPATSPAHAAVATLATMFDANPSPEVRHHVYEMAGIVVGRSVLAKARGHKSRARFVKDVTSGQSHERRESLRLSLSFAGSLARTMREEIAAAKADGDDLLAGLFVSIAHKDAAETGLPLEVHLDAAQTPAPWADVARDDALWSAAETALAAAARLRDECFAEWSKMAEGGNAPGSPRKSLRDDERT